ncbi:MAG: SpoIIE family protein phosphatase [Verrucomicrobia bacterium]|nr:SpoIIE family protein phosphatase [Verrucomicrobiota bacterium]
MQGARNVVLQITSRTRARNLLELFNSGSMTLEDYVRQSGIILEDALRLSDEVIGITRLGFTGKQLVHVGRAFPPTTWPEAAAGEDEVLLRGPLEFDGNLLLVISAPIKDAAGNRAGTDIVCFRFNIMEEILADRNGLGETGELVLGTARNGSYEIISRPHDAERLELAVAAETQAAMIRRALAGQTDVMQEASPAGKPVLMCFGPVDGTPWAALATMNPSELYSSVNRQIALVMLGITGLALAGAFGMFLLVRPLTGGILIHSDVLQQRIDDATRRLKEHNRLLRAANLELAEHNTRFKEELRLAQNVQMGFLPTRFPHEDRIVFDKYYLTCEILGGDLFDVFEVGQHHVAMYVADVAGHGVSAALISGLLKMAISSIRQTGEQHTHGFNPDLLSPGHILEVLNSQLYDEMPKDEFITMIYAILDLRSMEFTMADAGHPRPLQYRTETQTLETVTFKTGAALGLIHNETYQEFCYEVRPGDQIVFYTDGVTEALNGDDEEFGESRLYETLSEAFKNKPQHVTAAIQSAVEHHRNGREVSDDFTILACAIR